MTAISTKKKNLMGTKSVPPGWRCIGCMGAAKACFLDSSSEEVMACSRHAEHKERKVSPPVGCWFWAVPRSMLLEAFTCWSCHWFSPGAWGWAVEELWQFFLEEAKKKKKRNKIFKTHFAYMIYSTFCCHETWITGIISLWIKDSSSLTCCVCRRTNCLCLFHENSARSPLPPLCESSRHWSLKASRERGKCAAVMDQIEKAAIVLASLQLRGQTRHVCALIRGSNSC